MAKTVQVIVVANVKVPVVPNFLIYNGKSIPVGDVTNDKLKEIAKIWLEKLIENADR